MYGWTVRNDIEVRRQQKNQFAVRRIERVGIRVVPLKVPAFHRIDLISILRKTNATFPAQRAFNPSPFISFIRLSFGLPHGCLSILLYLYYTLYSRYSSTKKEYTNTSFSSHYLRDTRCMRSTLIL